VSLHVAAIVIWQFEIPLDQKIRAIRAIRILFGGAITYGQSFLKEHGQIQFKGDCSWSALANEALPSTTRRARAFDTLAAREQAVVADAVKAAYSET
jgi:hypothetical protein